MGQLISNDWIIRRLYRQAYITYIPLGHSHCYGEPRDTGCVAMGRKMIFLSAGLEALICVTCSVLNHVSVLVVRRISIAGNVDSISISISIYWIKWTGWFWMRWHRNETMSTTTQKYQYAMNGFCAVKRFFCTIIYLLILFSFKTKHPKRL